MVTNLVEPISIIEGRAFGELKVLCRWTITSDQGLTTARYDWKVETTKPWMNLLAPVARPFFSWNHDVVMGWGGEGLAQQLGVELFDRTH